MLAAEFERRGHVVRIFDYNLWSKQYKEFRRQAQTVDAVHFIGAVGLRKFWQARFIRKRLKAALLVHIVGSEIVRFRKIGLFDKWMWLAALKQAHRVFAVAPWLTDEWNARLSVETFPVFFRDYQKRRTRSPQNFTVLVYLPQSRPEFYGAEIVKRLIEQHPEMRFLLLGHNPCKQARPNVTALPVDFNRDMNEVYNQSSVLLRLTEHDGLSNMVLEALANDLPVVWTYSLPHVITVERRYEAVEKTLNELREHPAPIHSSTWAGETFHFKRLTDQLLDLYEHPLRPLKQDFLG